MQSEADRSYLATSEGTALLQPSASTRMVIQGETRADDGMDLLRVETFQAASPDQLPSEKELAAKVDKIAQDLNALRCGADRQIHMPARQCFPAELRQCSFTKFSGIAWRDIASAMKPKAKLLRRKWASEYCRLS